MKRVLLVVFSLVVGAAIYAQDNVKEHYTISGGVLGALNESQFRIPNGNGYTVKYHFKGGWGAGAWVNFPIANAFSIEPQVQFNSYGYHLDHTSATTPLLMNDGKIKYFSIPVFLKFNVSNAFAITAGPQMDFINRVEDNSPSAAQKSDFNKNSFSVFGGFELFPHGRVSLFARYIHGMSSLDERVGESPAGIVYKNQAIQAGLKLRLFGSKTSSTYKASSTPVVVPDSDGDGITDDVDKCPNTPGLAKYNGCPIPDSDNDGVNDELDKCPNVPGLAKYDGCPIPDSDNDGINDELDKCPNTPGLAKYNGCPAPDRDNDGINDDEDHCPDIAGTVQNHGCPDVPAEVNKLFASSASTVIFTINSSKLATRSNASLNKVVSALQEHPEVKIKLEGHADNSEKNTQEVSEARAAAVKSYMVSKGISEDRISVEGFGDTMPVADNGTAAGRVKNRRVEIKVNY